MNMKILIYLVVVAVVVGGVALLMNRNNTAPEDAQGLLGDVALNEEGMDFVDESFYKIFRGLSFNNTGITLMEYEPEKNRWHLRYLNDYMHLK